MKAVDGQGAAQSREKIDRNSDAWGVLTSDLVNLITLVLDNK